MPGCNAILRGATAAVAAVAFALAGCGGSGGSGDGQATTYPVAIPRASFPARQSLAEHVELQLAVHNAGHRTIPGVAATLAMRGGASVQAFGARLPGAGLASHSRPVWIVDQGPPAGATAYTNTWALGAIRPGRTRTFVWRVTAVRAGRYTLRYRLTGTVDGRSSLRLADGGAPRGSFDVDVSGKPATVRVTPDGTIVSVPG